MKVNEMYELYNGLNVLSQIELPIKVAFLVQQNLSSVETEVNNADKIKQSIVDRYIDKEKTKELQQEGKNMIQLQVDKIENYNKEINELNDQPVKLKLKKLKLDDLGNMKIRPIILKQISNILE